MARATVTVELPDRLYELLQHRAQNANRTVEAELIELLASALPDDGESLERFGGDLIGLELLDDEELRRAGRSHLAVGMARRLESLHRKRQREGLSEVEAQTVVELMRQYERAMVVRAQAAALLKKRGHTVSIPARPE